MSDLKLNDVSLDSLCAALAAAAGLPAPACAAAPNEALMNYLNGRVADRLFLYNPDAVAEWIMDKYPGFFTYVTERCDCSVSYQTVMPSVTPVCFGTFYTGAQPAVHGIQKYEKPVIKIDTLFDVFIRAGKKCAILGTPKCSMSHIFLERDMDYYPLPTVAAVNAKAAELILEDRYDLLVVYNGNYDSTMHKNGPESPLSLAAARCNDQAFGTFYEMIREHWKHHNTFMAFAMDHGCHEIDGECGSHGLDMPEDLNIRHYYQFIEAQQP